MKYKKDRPFSGITDGEMFMNSYNFMLANEGGFSDHIADHGGPTRYGISYALAKNMFNNGSIWLDANKNGKIDKEDLFLLTPEQIKRIYFEQFWKPVSKIKDAVLVCKVFDAAVNLGVPQAVKLLQQSVGTEADGILGKITLGAIEKKNAQSILASFIENLCCFYNRLAIKDPTQKVFLKGWLNRAKRLPHWA